MKAVISEPFPPILKELDEQLKVDFLRQRTTMRMKALVKIRPPITPTMTMDKGKPSEIEL